jgi:hypothetical protein
MGIPAWIAAVGVVGTWFIFVAAIWGEKIRSSLFKLELQVTLDNPRGVAVNQIISTGTMRQVGSTLQTEQYTRPSRYYLRSVRNTRRWPIAHDVRS